MRVIILRPQFLIGYFFGFLCVFGLQDDFYQIHWVMDLTEFGMSLVPSIAGYGVQSKFPKVSVFYFSIQWLIFLPTFYDLLKNKDLNFNKKGFGGIYETIRRRSFPKLLCIFAILFCLALICIAWIQPGYQFALMPINEFRLALAVFGPLVGAFLIYILISFMWCYLIFFVKLWRNDPV